MTELGRLDMGRYSRGWILCLGSGFEDEEEAADDEGRGVRKIGGEGKGSSPNSAIC